MQQQNNSHSSVPNPRRRKRSKMRIFRECYLPVIIAALALILVVTFIVSAIVRGVQNRKAEQLAQQASEAAAQRQQELWQHEAISLIAQSQQYTVIYDYNSALNVLESFSGNMADFPELTQAHDSITAQTSQLTAWTDPGKVLNLSFQLLIEDPVRAFADENYGSSYRRNFITTAEFSAILQQLYDGGYVLVSLNDLVTEQPEQGFSAGMIHLPAGKKPLLLTQTQVNYNTYMVDGDGDKLPDKDGAGFACKLIVDSAGSFKNEYIDAQGNTLTGDYDFIPILESFIATHPDFSYHDARAVIAVTGYDGLFGYRTNESAKQRLGEEAYAQETANAQQVISALRSKGYELACYSYDHIAYGYTGSETLKNDLSLWASQVTPLLGDVDTLIFPLESDIAANGDTYSGDKYDILKNAGFRKYVGFCSNGTLWADIRTDYFRIARILVSAANLQNNAQWFDGILTPDTILSADRNS